MLTITKSPAPHSFSGNPLVYRLSSNDWLASSGAFASILLVFSGIDTASGHGFNLYFDQTDHVFISINFPGYSGYGIPTANPSWNHNQYAAAVYECLAANHQLRSRYRITLSEEMEFTRTIQFVALERGDRWTIDLKDVTLANLIHTSRVEGADRVPRTNFGVVATLWDTSGEKIGEDLKGVDSEGAVSFDLSDYLKSRFTLAEATDPDPRFVFPESCFENYAVHRQFVLEFTASFAERYDGTVKKMIFDTSKYSLSGGLSRDAISYFNSLGTDYFSHADNKFRFLSTSPAVKVTGKSQPEKLWFYFVEYTNPFTFRLCVKVTFSDLTTSSFYGSELVHSFERPVIELMVGYAKLNLGNIDPSKEVLQWEVWLEDDDLQVISEVRTLTLDPLVREFERTFIFRSSMGGYEVARFTGTGETTVENERQTVILQSFEDFSFRNPPSRVFDSFESLKCKANTGWISREQREAMRDFLLSTECYEILDDLLFPVVVSSTRIRSFSKDGEYMYNMEVEYERAYNDSYYTSTFKPISMITTEDLTQGVGVIFEASEDLTYFGYPKFGTTSESDATWRIKRIEKVLVGGKPKYIVKWADGNLNYDNVFANCQSLTYGFISS